MSWLYSGLARNGEILDLVKIDNNNYLISINAGNQRNKINSYQHIKTSKQGIEVIGPNIGNKVEIISKKCLILLDPDNGYYLYDVFNAKRTSPYFKMIKQVQVDDGYYIYATDTIRNMTGDFIVRLGTLLNEQGNFISGVLNINTDESYKNITTEEEYVELKKDIRTKIDGIDSDEKVICKKLLKQG